MSISKLRRSKRPRRGYQTVTPKPKKNKNKRLRDFKAENVPESLAREGMMEEYGHAKDMTYVYWAALILGVILILLNVTDTPLSIEFGDFKYGGTLVGLPLAAWGVYHIKNAPKPNVEIKNITKD